ncbi:putative post-transcriptional gene silencing PAZ-Argonaute family protein [Helianthus annuus]|nr:putative post-transcriptional gene silencing PAZ-Argonaute family protein [Helianthus annuus]
MDQPITGIATTLLLELDMDSLPRNKHELTVILKDVTSNRYIPGPVVDFLINNQNVKDPYSIDWAKAKRTLKNLRVKASPTNTEYKITGLSEKPFNEQLKNWKQVQHNLYLLIQVSVKCARILKCVLAWLWSGYIELPIYVAELTENGGNIKKFSSIIHLFKLKT